RAANDHPCLERQAGEYGIENVAADVVEIHVHAFRAFALEAGDDVFVLVIDSAVKAQLVDQELALVCAPRDADHAAAFELGNLSGHAADRTGRAGDHHGFTGLRRADIEQ